MSRAETTPAPDRLPVKRLLAGGGLLVIICCGIGIVRLFPLQVTALMRHAAAAEQGLGAAGWLLAFGVQVLVALCGVLPASAGAIAAGMAFGVVGGFCVCGSATILGALLAFGLARSLLRPAIARALARHPRMIRLDEAVTRDGWRLVVLMRISPLMPFAVTSYALGLSSLELRAYLAGTLASLPALLGYVVVGSLAGQSLDALATGRRGTVHWIGTAAALLATVLLTIRLARIIAAALRLPEQQVRLAPDAGNAA